MDKRNRGTRYATIHDGLAPILTNNRYSGGQKVFPMRPGQNRPDIDLVSFSPRTLWTNIGLFQNGFECKNALKSMLETIQTTLFPAVLWAVAANSVFIIANQAAAQLSSFALLAQG